MKRLKILIVAYACSPVRGSEPGMGWSFITEIAKHHDIWVIVEKEKFESEIKEELIKSPYLEEHIKFHFIEKTRHRLLRKLWPPSYYWFYRDWHKKAYKLAVLLHKEIDFDIFHQLNMVGFREPGYLWEVSVPFVWGPVGGLNQVPVKFLSCMGWSGAIFYLCRNIFNFIQQRLLQRPRLAAIKAGKGLIAATNDTSTTMSRLWGVKSQVICEVGQFRLLNHSSALREKDEPLRIAWSGLHISRKALPLLLNALKNVNPDMNWELNVLGLGPLTPNWKALAESNNISERCKWHGWLSKTDAVKIMENSHVFVITSLSDLTSTVTLEALSLGLPVICLDHCGFSDVVTEQCGIKIAVVEPLQVIDEMAKAIEKIWKDEAMRRQLSAGALERVKDYSWENKMKSLNQIYENVINGDK